ncbi:MAG: hypothetical protein IPL61_04740 [Myxococcales bacterium]|nr:hypothetical protein [Myxococcales bacterium]
MVVADLRVVADAQVDRVVAAALAAADVAAAAHERRARVADARVTAIAGAEDELGLGPDLARRSGRCAIGSGPGTTSARPGCCGPCWRWRGPGLARR